MRQGITAIAVGSFLGVIASVVVGWVWMVWGANPAKDRLLSFVNFHWKG